MTDQWVPALGGVGTWVRAGLLGVAAHAGMCAALSVVGAAHVRTETPRVALVPLVAVAAVPLVARAGVAGLVPTTAVAWLAAGLAHHYLVGLDPQWGSDPVRGLGHLAWDAVFHAPPVLLVALGRPRALPSEVD